MGPDALEPSFQDLDDAIDAFYGVTYPGGRYVLERLVSAFDAEPLSSFLSVALPEVDLAAWIADIQSTKGAMAGSGVLKWPADRGKRVALQVGLVRRFSQHEGELYSFSSDFCYTGTTLISDRYARFADVVLRPLVHDLRRLTENRVLPPILFEAMGTLPTSGDATLDDLLREAIKRFRDPAPTEHKLALERLWDAFERIKTLRLPSDKRRSVDELIAAASPDPAFREQLQQDARSLTEIGNAFHIRHFEANKSALNDPLHVEYLFHRLFALVRLLLYHTQK